MASEQQDEADEVVQEDAEEAPVHRKSRKKLVIAAVGALVLLLGAGGGGYALLAPGDAGEGGEAQAEAVDVETFVDVPPLTVNLRGADGAPRFLRVHLMLVPSSAEAGEEVTRRLPLIIDAYQPFLRELRPEDLSGSAAAFRLKEEMLVRANDAAGAGSVTDVLIQDLVQQ